MKNVQKLEKTSKTLNSQSINQSNNQDVKTYQTLNLTCTMKPLKLLTSCPAVPCDSSKLLLQSFLGKDQTRLPIFLLNI